MKKATHIVKCKPSRVAIVAMKPDSQLSRQVTSPSKDSNLLLALDGLVRVTAALHIIPPRHHSRQNKIKPGSKSVAVADFPAGNHKPLRELDAYGSPSEQASVVLTCGRNTGTEQSQQTPLRPALSVKNAQHAQQRQERARKPYRKHQSGHNQDPTAHRPCPQESQSQVRTQRVEIELEALS